jgi:hypothetical protein
LITELEACYEQIEKLNGTLRGKDREINNSRALTLYSAKIVPERDVSPNNSTYWRKEDFNHFATNSSRQIVSPQQVNIGPSKSYSAISKAESTAFPRK